MIPDADMRILVYSDLGLFPRPEESEELLVGLYRISLWRVLLFLFPRGGSTLSLPCENRVAHTSLTRPFRKRRDKNTVQVGRGSQETADCPRV